MKGLEKITLGYKITATFINYPNKTAVQYLTITLLNVCVTSRFTNPSAQAAVYYEDGSNVLTAVGAFTYTSDQLGSDCNFSHEFFYRNTIQDAWSTVQPAYVTAPNTSTLAFSIQTNVASIATPGDSIASRWVKRRHYNPYSGQEIVQEMQIFFVKSLFCYQKTAALVSPSTLNLANAIVGTSKTILSQFDTNTGVLVTTANDATHCNYSAVCQIFDAST